eukprot:5545628-Amphidinium_carterae.1
MQKYELRSNLTHLISRPLFSGRTSEHNYWKELIARVRDSSFDLSIVTDLAQVYQSLQLCQDKLHMYRTQNATNQQCYMDKWSGGVKCWGEVEDGHFHGKSVD